MKNPSQVSLNTEKLEVHLLKKMEPIKDAHFHHFNYSFGNCSQNHLTRKSNQVDTNWILESQALPLFR